MSKYLNVTTGDYKIKVQEGGLIELDTGRLNGDFGKVIIHGDLDVRGETTTINSTELTFEDNIVVLNRPADGDFNFNGVLRDSGTAGLRVERGNLTDTFWVYDENLRWLVTGSGTSRSGAWSPRDDSGEVIGVELSSITTPAGTDLNLLGRYADGSGSGAASSGLVTVRGTNTAAVGNSYAQRIIALPSAEQDDVIPNVFYLNQVVNQQLSTSFQDTIQEGTFTGTETRVEVQDNTVAGNDSVIILAVNGITKAEYTETEAQLFNVEISGTGASAGKIASKTSVGNQNLVLTAEGVGRVVIQDDVVLTRTPHDGTGVIDPLAPADGVSLYNKNEDLGGTGVFFVNQEGTRDELISKKRAIFYSMMF